MGYRRDKEKWHQHQSIELHILSVRWDYNSSFCRQELA